MVLSNDGTFELTLVDPFRQCKGKPLEYKHIMTPEGICVIGEAEQHFILNLECKDRGVYGIRVIVDGYTLPGKKTFKSKTKIQGFTNSDGNINCFKFQRPKIDVLSTNVFKKNIYRPPWDLEQNDYRDYPGGAGEIIVKIYETRQEESKGGRGGGGGGPPRQSNDPVFQEVAKNESKDQLDQCLGIGQGNVIELPPRQSFDDSRPPRPFRDVIVYEHIVQSFRLVYMDVQTLVDKKFVKLGCHNHISYLNEEYFQGNEPAMLQVLQTLIESGQQDKEASEIEQSSNILVERLDYYFTGELLNVFMSKENQEQLQLDAQQRATFLEGELTKFMEQWPEFFVCRGGNVFAIKAKFDQNVFVEKIKERDQQI